MGPNANVPYVDLVYNGFIIIIFSFTFFLSQKFLIFTLCSCYCVFVANMLVLIIISSFVLFNLCFLF